MELDETATAERIAEADLWLPAFEPAQDRWFSLDLIVDRSRSMDLWHSTIRELAKLLSLLGAFQDVRLWHLFTKDGEAQVEPHLRSGTPLARSPHSPVRDILGRHLTLLLTDCVAAPWRDGTYARLLRAFQANGPVAMIQLLPEHLWVRTALREARPIRFLSLTSHRQAAAVNRCEYIYSLAMRGSSASRREAVAVPVLSLHPVSFRRWARWLTGRSAWAPGFELAVEGAELTQSAGTRVHSVLSYRARLEVFWRSAPPATRRLAYCVAASPAVTLPILRVIRKTMVPQAGQPNEAELLLSGLLKVISDADDAEEVIYSFPDGVRQQLLDNLSRPDAQRVLMLERVSEFIDRRLVGGRSFRAAIRDPQGETLVFGAQHGAFATVTGKILRRVGGSGRARQSHGRGRTARRLARGGYPNQMPPPRDWQVFEDFCRDLFAAEWGDPETQKHGRQGQQLHGVDVFGRRNGKWQGVQCKHRRVFPEIRLTEKQVLAEVKAASNFSQPLETLVIATTAPPDTQLQVVARAISEKHGDEGPQIVVYGWSELCQVLEQHDKVFGVWRRKLNERPPTQVPPPRDWRVFEDFCRDLFSAEWGDPETKKHGRPGQAQHGVDVYGRRGGRWQAVQCKRRRVFPEKQLTKAEVQAEVKAAEKFARTLETLVIATTAPPDTQLQALAMRLTEEHGDDGPRIVIYSWSELCEKLDFHDNVSRVWRRQLYEKPPTPDFSDEASRKLAEALEQAQLKHEELTSTGADPSLALEEILDIKRRLREGGQLQPGDFLADGRFRILERLGRGGFSSIFKAYDRKNQQLVAAKVLHGQYVNDRSHRERFFRGARKMSELQHEGIVRVIEPKLEDGGYHFFVMEYVEGGDLRQAVLDGRLTDLAILRDIAHALDFVHQKGIVHRDVKPANILLTLDGHAKLTDFDLVRAFDTTGGTRSGSMLGSFLYMAPESMHQAKDVDSAADVYSLAMTAAFVLHGEELPPTALRDPGGFFDRLEVPQPARDVLERASSWEPEERPPTATGLLETLEAGTTRRGDQEPAATVDVGIITVKEEEYEALLDKFSPTETLEGRNRDYDVASIETDRGVCRVAITRSVQHGNAHAQNTATELLRDLDPSFVLAVGIAGSVPTPDFCLGDVVISDYIQDLTLEATGTGQSSRRHKILGGPLHPSATRIVERLRAIERANSWNTAEAVAAPRPGLEGTHTTDDIEWNAEISAALERHSKRSAPLATVRKIASSDRLIKAPELLKTWRTVLKAVSAVEMESAGVYIPCQRYNIPVLAIRGISDIVGWERDEGWTLYACHTAAAYARMLVGAGVFFARGST
ncbi:MAG: protein kinase [bacterium]|nr:protein kinase [bacterium]